MAEVRELPVAEHPAFLHGFTKVDSPALKPVIDGEPTLGWAGDDRLCFYLGDEGRYYLYRQEWDGEYRLVCRSKPFELLTPDGVNRMIRDLIRCDSRRGFDPVDATLGYNDRRRHASEHQFGEYVHEEVSPRIVHWATHAHLPGIDVAPKLR